MSLPVSQYEALLAEVRGLRRKAQKVQQLATPLLSSNTTSSFKSLQNGHGTTLTSTQSYSLEYEMESVSSERQHNSLEYTENINSDIQYGQTYTASEHVEGTHSTQVSVSSEPIPHENRDMSLLYHGTWPVERIMWNSEPTNLDPSASCNRMDMTSVMSFAYSSGGAQLDHVLSSDKTQKSSQQLEAKVDMVYSLLSMLGGQEHADMGATLLALSSSPESCLAMRQSGCIPLLVQLVQSDGDAETRKKAAQALNNLIHSNPDEKLKKRETRILKLLNQICTYTAYLHNQLDVDLEILSPTDDEDKHPVQTVAHLMKLSFDEIHRQAICQLGGIHTISKLVQSEHAFHGSTADDGPCVLLRRYSCMVLTNLTFGDSGNKALLCSFKDFICALVVQLQSPCDELRQVTASVLRNLSWRADSTCKEILREVGTVTGLMKAAMLNNKENTLKSILSALWNLSAHCTENKSEICEVEGALGFLVNMLSYKTPSKSLVITENAGGILRNISSQIAIREDYREILRNHNCLQILLEQLKSPSLTIVSNACGTLWNLSAKNQKDQETLWQIGAPAMLRSLNHSKHKMIAMGSSAALKNLLSSRPSYNLMPQMDATAQAMELPSLPTLGARKQKALLQELEQNLSETFENIDKDSPIPSGSNNIFKQNTSNKGQSGSQECISYAEKGVYETCTSHNDSGILNDSFINKFGSLSINEPLSSYQNRTRVPQNYENAGLPYLKPTVPYIPVQKYVTCSYEEESETTEQPIDYSRKYSETKITKSYNSACSNEKKSFSYSSSVSKDVADETFGIYTETDLDQPTDYSLRYAEDDVDLEVCGKIEKTESADYVQDTLKTYCTEGTPYETPFNYSTATSMSDLRDPNFDIEKQKVIIDNNKAIRSVTKCSEKLSQSDEKDRCSIEDVSEINNTTKLATETVKSELASELISPEKTLDYTEEEAASYFSRVNNFGQLSSVPVNEKLIPNGVKKKDTDDLPIVTNEQKVDVLQTEGKAVKFEQVVNYAEETPLMFSRTSSLASLDSIEQHSIHEDRESVISDFSRLTSGLVSPSELPDSPTQTIPPSPRLQKTPIEFSTVTAPQSVLTTTAKVSVFEDNITKFKEENTPVHFSTATSLSSLTIDDHDEAARFDNKSSIKADVTDGRSQIVTQKESPRSDNKKESDDNSKISNARGDLAISESEEDEDILAACISDGMQNNRHRQSNSAHSKLPSPTTYKHQSKTIPRSSGIPLPRVDVRKPMVRRAPSTSIRMIDNQLQNGINSDSVHNYCTEGTPAMLSHANSNSDLSVLTTTTDRNHKKEQNYLSDDSSNLSEDNDNILAECIQSAMPKARNLDKPVVHNKQMSGLPIRNVQSTSAIKPFLETNRNCSRSLESKQTAAASAKLEMKNSVDQSNVKFDSVNGFGNLEDQNNPSCSNLSQSVDLNTSEEKPMLSRQNSLSSLSADSLVSLEQEQALLEQCISSGMPKSKTTPISNTLVEPNVPESKSIGASTKQFSVNKTHKSLERTYENETVSFVVDHKSAHSKNVNVTSVVKNMRVEAKTTCPITPPMAADGDFIERNVNTNLIHGIQEDTLQNKTLHIKENSWTELTKNGCNKSEQILVNNEENPGTETIKESNSAEFDFENINLDVKAITVDTRMLDPDAMIESLDRFTAQLVSQAEAAHSNKDGKQLLSSTNDVDTWNEDGSTSNDITFPTISGSVPNVVTFDSENKEEISLEDHWKLDIKNEHCVNINNNEQQSNDFSSLDTNTMTESTIIAAEATKIAAVLKNEVDMVQSLTSVNSLELDNIQPPSHMNSLTNSTTGLELQSLRDSPKLMRRKRSVQFGLLARRALSNSLNQASSLESLDNHSLSNLDHMNPPSAMAEVLDMIDLEGSMMSVASLTSEIFDSKPESNGSSNKSADKDEEPNPIFNIKQPTHVLTPLTNNFVSDLENINPPSLFNEITDMCNSLADITTEVICSETEAFEDCNTHFVETTLQTEDDITQFSDAQSITPIQSDFSSAESSPKKSKTLNKRLTPKQRRKLVQERYRTYTVAAEMVVSEELNFDMDSVKTDDCFSEYHTVNDGLSNIEDGNSSPGKLTPKQRRKSDRARFQTQVLDEAVTSALRKMCSSHEIPSETEKVCDVSPVHSSNNQSSHKSPCKSKLVRKQNFLQKRLENQDRFRTRTLSESSLSPDISSASQTQSTGSNNDLQKLVQKEANKVLKNLKETRLHSDELLDCETLSLISNEDDSEYNSGCSINYRTYTKNYNSMNKYIPQPITETKNRSNIENIKSECNNADSKKPKITKPNEHKQCENEEQEISKGIRGRRKPLYVKTDINNARVVPKSNNARPIRNITSNLVKNVTSVIKSGTNLRNVAAKQIKTNNRNTTASPMQVKTIKPPSGYRANISKTNATRENLKPEKLTKKLLGNSCAINNPQFKNTSAKGHASHPPILERQGTFTKLDQEVTASKSFIPTPITSNLPIPKSTSRITKSSSQPNVKPISKVQSVATTSKNVRSITLAKSASSDRSSKLKNPSIGAFSRSSSADSRDFRFKHTNIHNSSSSQNLKSDGQGGSSKRSSLSNISCRSNSNSSITSTGSASKKPVVKSKIASYWKTDASKQIPKNGTRLSNEIKQSTSETVLKKLTRSNTFETKDASVLKNEI